MSFYLPTVWPVIEHIHHMTLTISGPFEYSLSQLDYWNSVSSLHWFDSGTRPLGVNVPSVNNTGWFESSTALWTCPCMRPLVFPLWMKCIIELCLPACCQQHNTDKTLYSCSSLSTGPLQRHDNDSRLCDGMKRNTKEQWDAVASAWTEITVNHFKHLNSRCLRTKDRISIVTVSSASMRSIGFC